MNNPRVRTLRKTSTPKFFLLVIGLTMSVCAVSTAAAQDARARPEFPISIEQAETRAATHRAAMFATTDTDKDGYLSVAEFVAAERPNHGDSGSGRHSPPHHRSPPGVEHQAPSASDVAEMEDSLFALLDTDGNGELSRNEFSRELQQAAHQTLAKTRMFHHLDRNGDKHLTMDEMPDPTDRLRKMDANADGEVTRDEMRAAMQTRRSGA